jgi:ligand-binding sensor domain-containing protein
MQDEDETLWVGTANGVYLYRPEWDAFSLLDDTTADGESIDGIVRDIRKDKNGYIWMAVSGKGLFCYSPQHELRFFPMNHIHDNINIRKIDFDTESNVWIATYRYGLFKLIPQTGVIKQFLPDTDKNNPSGNDINDIFFQVR